jgi:hypothetical protein
MGGFSGIKIKRKIMAKESEYKRGFRDGMLAAYRAVRRDFLDKKILDLQVEHEELYPEMYDRR